VLVPFHEESSLWPYPRAPLDDRDDIVELDFADTSALSDVDAFERRRQNGRNAKLSKKDRAAKEREEIERSWDVPGNAAPSLVAAGSPGPHPVLGRPSSSQAPAHNTVVSSFANGSAAAWPSPQLGAHKVNQTNAASAPVKTPEPSSTGGPASPPAPPTGNNKNKSIKAKSKHAVNGSNAKVTVPDTTQTHVNGTTALAQLPASAAIVEAVQAHAHSNVNGSSSLSMTTDRNEFVREVLTLIHVRAFLSPLPIVLILLTFSLCFASHRFFFCLILDGSFVRGSTLDGISCAGLGPLPTDAFFFIGVPTVYHSPLLPVPPPVTWCRTEISLFMYCHDVSHLH
jgi:cytoskeletal protein RodZ